MNNLVSADDVLNRWLPITQAPRGKEEQVELFINDLLDDALERISDLEERLESGALRETTLKRVIAGAVIRVWKVAYDPRSNYSESAGAFSQSGSFGNATNRDISLTEAEIRRLSGEHEAGQVFTLSLIGSPSKGHTEVWRDL